VTATGERGARELAAPFCSGRPTLLFGTAALLLGCGAGPQVQATGAYRADALQNTRILFVPLAVSDELGDERTGVILSDQARSIASEEACKAMQEESSASAEQVVCLDQHTFEHSPALGELERLFARDQPIPASVWQSVRQASGAKHALLFRPESVSSSRDVSHRLEGSSGAQFGTGTLLATTIIASVLVGASTIHKSTVSKTELGYTVSASLVDMQSGALLKVGVHSASDSRKERRNLGFAEPPPAAPLLQRIMVALGEKLLTD
jgi:hypothetical protein